MARNSSPWRSPTPASSTSSLVWATARFSDEAKKVGLESKVIRLPANAAQSDVAAEGAMEYATNAEQLRLALQGIMLNSARGGIVN